MDTQTLANLGLVLLFVLVGGVFAGTELALVSLREGPGASGACRVDTGSADTGSAWARCGGWAMPAGAALVGPASGAVGGAALSVAPRGPPCRAITVLLRRLEY